MTNDSRTIFPLGEDQIETAGRIVARSFQHYPLMTYQFPDPDERTRVLPALLTWNVRHGVLFGETFALDEPLRGVAVLFGPASDAFSDAQMHQSGFWQLADELGPAAWERMSAAQDQVFAFADAQLHAAVHEPHWYLDIIAVDPMQQGRGIGSAFITAIHERLDPTSLPVALLTHDPRTVPFYLRHGYELVCEGTEPLSGISHWGFRRNPNSRALQTQHH